MRKALIVIGLMIASIATADAQVSFGIDIPGARIGFNLPAYPQLVPVPGYPVYYAPRIDANYFFYDGMYWLYANDSWYASSWYNGPWHLVTPDEVPLYVLRVPVRYYRHPPPYFRSWRADAAPRWGEHWGHGWAEQHQGWDRWDRRHVPTRAPLPRYQRQYAGDRYPHTEDRRQAFESRNYHYRPRDEAVRRHFEAQHGSRQFARDGDRRGHGRDANSGGHGRAEGYGGGDENRHDGRGHDAHHGNDRGRGEHRGGEHNR